MRPITGQPTITRRMIVWVTIHTIDTIIYVSSQFLPMPAYLWQHLLTDTAIRLAIADHIRTLCVSHAISCLIEIGPGKWSLTDLIDNCAPYFLACELDPAMIRSLTTTHKRDLIASASDPINPSCKKVLLHQNALACDINHYLRQRGIDPHTTLIVGNLPYYITSPLLTKFAHPTYAWWVFLIQDDVTEKIVTTAKKKSFLRRKLTATMAIDKILHVPPAAFTPPPKVQSSVITTLPLPPDQRQTRVTDTTYDLISKLSHAKRKTIRANARQAGLDWSARDPSVLDKRIEELNREDIRTIKNKSTYESSKSHHSIDEPYMSFIKNNETIDKPNNISD